MSIDKILYYESKSFNPYQNLSYEEKLMEKVNEGELIFYLWQNKNTVVIGRNQSAKDQCNLDLMKKNNILLARRSSGGGAVYHDLGNLNFTFISKNKDFDIAKHLQVIKQSLNEFEIYAYFSGRNDLLVDGYKISGQAYLKTSDVSLHHGTLLVNVDLSDLTKYLKKDLTKLKTHGVKSHIQRVKNISEFNNRVNISNIKESLKKVVSKVYNCPLIEKEIAENDLCNKYFSQKWLYRLNLNSKRIKKRFGYGLIDINFEIVDNLIVDVLINSDIMDVNIVDEIKENLINKEFNKSLIKSITLSNKIIESDVKKMIEDEICTT